MDYDSVCDELSDINRMYAEIDMVYADMLRVLDEDTAHEAIVYMQETLDESLNPVIARCNNLLDTDYKEFPFYELKRPPLADRAQRWWEARKQIEASVAAI